MKRIISLVLAGAMAMGIAACNKPVKQSTTTTSEITEGTQRAAPAGVVYSLAGKSTDDIKAILTNVTDVKDGDKFLEYPNKFDVQPETLVISESKTDYAYYFPTKDEELNCITDITLLEIQVNASEAIVLNDQSMAIISMKFDDADFAKTVYKAVDQFRSDMAGFSVYDEYEAMTDIGYRWSKDIRRDGGSPLSFNLSLYPEDSHYIVYAQIPLKR